MNERDNGDLKPQEELTLQLPDGREFTAGNKIQFSLLEGFLMVSEKFPASLDELGRYVYGDGFDLERDGTELRIQLDGLSGNIKRFGYVIVEDAEEKKERLWLGPADQIDQKTEVVSSKETPTSIAALVESVLDNLWRQISPLDRDKLTEAFFRDPQAIHAQIREVARMLRTATTRGLRVPDSAEILAARADQKTGLVALSLRSLLYSSVIDPNDSNVRTKFSWGRKLGDLILLAGGGARGSRVLYEALGQLNDVERAIVLSQISMSKKYEIFKVGFDQVDEREMAFFLNMAASKFYRSGMADDLEEVISAVAERADSESNFSAWKVVDFVLQNYPDDAKSIFAHMMEVARQMDITFQLAAIFRSHPDTSRLVIIMDNWDYEDTYLPRNRRL